MTSPNCSGPVSPETRTTSQLSRSAELRRLLNLSLASALIKHVRCSSRLAHRPDRGTSYRNVAGLGLAARGSVRKPGPERIPAHIRHAAPSQWPPKRTRSQGTKKEQTQGHRTALDEPDAPLSCSECHRPCSMTRQRTVIPRSGRRGRRFKSCHPDCIPAGQRPLPELVRASLAASTAAKYRQYRNKSEHLTFSSNGFPQAAQRFARDEEAAG